MTLNPFYPLTPLKSEIRKGMEESRQGAVYAAGVWWCSPTPAVRGIGGP